MTQDFGQQASPAGSALNIQELQARGVNATWLVKLQAIHDAGVVSYKYGFLKTERPLPFLTKFSILAFLFNWIYYLIKGMWKKALFIIGAYVGIGIIGTILMMISPGFGSTVYMGLATGLSIYIAQAAPADYYRHVVLKENFWV